jgi:hypothetical protein
VANDTNTEKTEECLRSQVPKGTKFLGIGVPGDMIGWHNLFLDDEAKKAVEAYEGVRFLEVGG